MLQGYPWADSIPYPSMTGRFDNSTSHIDVMGLFDSNTLRGNIVGSAGITFFGSMGARKSDQLLLCEAGPKWNATLAFSRGVVLFRIHRILEMTTLEGCYGFI